MRKLTIALAAVAALLVAAPTTAQAATTQGGTPRVYGGGISSVDTPFGIAIVGGVIPRGYAIFDPGPDFREGVATCLRVVGNEAVFGVLSRVGERQFYVRDNGDSTTNPTDQLHEVPVGKGQLPGTCADPVTQRNPGWVLKTGNIRIVTG